MQAPAALRTSQPLTHTTAHLQPPCPSVQPPQGVAWDCLLPTPSAPQPQPTWAAAPLPLLAARLWPLTPRPAAPHEQPAPPPLRLPRCWPLQLLLQCWAMHCCQARPEFL